MSTELTRRTFIRKAALAGAAAATGAAITARPLRADPAATAVSGQKLRIAYIGVNGNGVSGRRTVEELGGAACPCYCDVDRRQFTAGRAGKVVSVAEQYPQAQAYQDYRRMFDKEHKNIDAVMIATPDHHHFPATMVAMQLGINCYTQKPLTHTVWEARQLAKAAERYPKVVTQMGNQGHGGDGWRLVYEWIHSGALGDITEVHAWTNRPTWPQGVARPAGEDPVPADLDWDVWLGPAPARPFKSEKAYHNFNWRGWWDFGTGAMGDMACHILDGMFWALDPGHPTSVEPVEPASHNGDSYPASEVIKWQFPAKGERKAFAAFWYDGGKLPARPEGLDPQVKFAQSGCLFAGTKASMILSGNAGDIVQIFPQPTIEAPPRLLDRNTRGKDLLQKHIGEWMAACRGDGKTLSNFAYAGPMTESLLLGNLAVRVGQKIEWDGPNLRITNHETANQWVNKPYREGWRYLV
jgi:predicted dehydrogenase